MKKLGSKWSTIRVALKRRLLTTLFSSHLWNFHLLLFLINELHYFIELTPSHFLQVYLKTRRNISLTYGLRQFEQILLGEILYSSGELLFLKNSHEALCLCFGLRRFGLKGCWIYICLGFGLRPWRYHGLYFVFLIALLEVLSQLDEVWIGFVKQVTIFYHQLNIGVKLCYR